MEDVEGVTSEEGTAFEGDITPERFTREGMDPTQVEEEAAHLEEAVVVSVEEANLQRGEGFMEAPVEDTEEVVPAEDVEELAVDGHPMGDQFAGDVENRGILKGTALVKAVSEPKLLDYREMIRKIEMGPHRLWYERVHGMKRAKR